MAYQMHLATLPNEAPVYQGHTQDHQRVGQYLWSLGKHSNVNNYVQYACGLQSNPNISEKHKAEHK